MSAEMAFTEPRQIYRYNSDQKLGLYSRKEVQRGASQMETCMRQGKAPMQLLWFIYMLRVNKQTGGGLVCCDAELCLDTDGRSPHHRAATQQLPPTERKGLCR